MLQLRCVPAHPCSTWQEMARGSVLFPHEHCGQKPAGTLSDCLAGWLYGCMVSCLHGWSVGWLDGWMLACLLVCTYIQCNFTHQPCSLLSLPPHSAKPLKATGRASLSGRVHQIHPGRMRRPIPWEQQVKRLHTPTWGVYQTPPIG